MVLPGPERAEAREPERRAAAAAAAALGEGGWGQPAKAHAALVPEGSGGKVCAGAPRQNNNSKWCFRKH